MRHRISVTMRRLNQSLQRDKAHVFSKNRPDGVPRSAEWCGPPSGGLYICSVTCQRVMRRRLTFVEHVAEDDRLLLGDLRHHRDHALPAVAAAFPAAAEGKLGGAEPAGSVDRDVAGLEGLGDLERGLDIAGDDA